MERGERAIEFGELVGLVAELVVVGIEAAESDEEDLPLHLQGRAHVDQARDHAQLATEVGIREHGRQRGLAIERLVDHDLVVHRAAHDRGVLALQGIAVRGIAQGQEHGATFRIPGLHEVDALRAILADKIRNHLVAGLEHVFAVDRDVHRQLLVDVGLVEHVGQAAAPAAPVDARRRSVCCQVTRLVAVREQLRRHRYRAGLVFAPW